jgi:hypothetical protein
MQQHFKRELNAIDPSSHFLAWRLLPSIDRGGCGDPFSALPAVMGATPNDVPSRSTWTRCRADASMPRSSLVDAPNASRPSGNGGNGV